MVNNKDSFVFNLVRYLDVLGADIVVVESDRTSISAIEDLDVDGIVLSPGPSHPQNAGICLPLVKALAGKMPILGVCLGHQVIGEAFGWPTKRAIAPTHGQAMTIRHSGSELFKGLPASFDVGLYHSLIVRRPSGSKSEPLRVDALSVRGEIMAMSHKELPIWGVQFHPESILTQNGMMVLENFLSLVKRHSQQ